MNDKGGTQAGPRKRLGEMLVEAGVVKPVQVELALALQRDEHDFIGQILIRLGFLDEATLKAFLAKQQLFNYGKPPTES